MIDRMLLEEAIALLELQTHKDYDDAFKFGRIASAKALWQKLLNLKYLREHLDMVIEQ